jgi:2-succinyl-5-enolpyruvyl-6-hydroxy-3-cyclohexene-1-carboxylate synthase
MIAMPYGTITFQNFKIILINNGGGGILEFYLDMKRPVFILFETSHCLTAEHLATMYGFEYTIASDESKLRKKV